MKLPNSNKAIISRDKLTDYVLSETHTTGKFKAKFFLRFGFNKANVNLLEQALRTLVESHEVEDVLRSEYGTKFIIDGEIDAPSGKSVNIRTICLKN